MMPVRLSVRAAGGRRAARRAACGRIISRHASQCYRLSCYACRLNTLYDDALHAVGSI